VTNGTPIIPLKVVSQSRR